MSYEPVFAVAVLIWTGILIYLILLDMKVRKLTKLIKEVEEHENK